MSSSVSSPLLHVGPTLWSMVTGIPRLTLCLIQYLISPWINWLCLPDLLLRNKSFGDTIGSGKYRRKKFAGSISIIYSIFCVFMFSSWLLLSMGLYNGNWARSEDLKGPPLLNRKLDYSAWGNLLSFIYPRENEIESSSEEDERNLQLALKRRVNLSSSLEKTQALLSPISHMARFSKFHSKSGKHGSEEIIPILFQGTINPPSHSITACVYSNQFWLDRISLFMKNWDGPVSLVIECFFSDRTEVMRRIEKLRDNDWSINHKVDFHLVTVLDGTPIQKLRSSERMVVNPIASNAHLNLARFFSRSDMVWLVGDARVLPSSGLYQLLSDRIDVRSRVLDYGDAIIIPNFAFNRENVVHPDPSWWNEGSNLNELAQQYINDIFSSISLPIDQWPKSRPELLNFSTKLSLPNSNLTILTMYDEAWEPTKGPSNWTMWENSATTVDSGVIEDGRSSRNVNKKLKGGDELYSIAHYDLKYAPNVVVSREGQPWCTERFEYNKAACVYQMYLTGTELWVMPEAWSITIQPIPPNLKKNKGDETLKDLISSRLYSKFHQEACMHYGREFSSLGAWDEDRSKHAKAICMHVLSSWGVGTYSSNIVL